MATGIFYHRNIPAALHKGKVRVSFGSNHHLTEEQIVEYFEDKRLSEGGPVEAIAEPGDGTYVLTFMNPEDAERVLYRNHKLNGVEMNVSAFVSEGIPSNGNYKDSTNVKVPVTDNMADSGLYDDISNTSSTTELKVPFDSNAFVAIPSGKIILKDPFANDDDDDDDDDDYDVNNGKDGNDEPDEDTQDIDVESPKLRYIQKHHKKDLQSISETVRKLTIDKKNVKFVIQGITSHVGQAVESINALLNNIDQESYTISRPRVLDFLKSPIGQEKIARIEDVTKTAIDVGEGLYAFIGGARDVAITVVYGDIAIQQADVLVSTVGPSLKLCEGVLSGQMLRAGGQELQTQCDMRCPDGIKEGEVIKTIGCKLKCKEVYHCCIPKWNGSNLKDLEDIIFLCLNDAAISGHKSITFPALGTGNSKYPAEKVARLMVAGMKPVWERLGCLETVTVVLNPRDAETITQFNAELQRCGEATVDDKIKVTENEIGIGKMSVKIKQGDITLEDTDCIVNSADSELTLSRAPLSRAISRACGNDLRRECQLKVAEMQKHGIVITTAPRLRANWIIHAAFQHFHGNIKEIVKACLKTAQHYNLSSISFPPLGTGYGSIPVDLMCKVLITALRKYCGKKSTLREIRVVIYEKDKHSLFLNKLREVVDKIEKEKDNIFTSVSTRRNKLIYDKLPIWKKVGSRKSKVTRGSLDRKDLSKPETSTEDSPSTEGQAGEKADYLVLCNVDGKTEEAEVNIFSPSPTNRKRAFEEIQKLCDHHIIEKTFLNMKLTTLNPSQIKQLKSSLTDMKMNMKITVYPQTGKVHVEGFRETVIEFQSNLSAIVDNILAKTSQT